MACDPWFELLSAAADGELDAVEQAALDGHLAACERCRATLAAFVDRRRRTLVHAAAPGPDLVDSVLAVRAAERSAGAVLRHRLAGAGAALVLAVAATAALAARTGPVVPTAEQRALTQVVDAERRAFDRPDLEVPDGSTVEWRNDSDTAHNLVRGFDGSTTSSPLAPGQTESVTFDHPGTYLYYCSIHPGMVGAVQVDA